MEVVGTRRRRRQPKPPQNVEKYKWTDVPYRETDLICDWIWVETESSRQVMMSHHLPHTRKELEKVFGVFESTNHRGWKVDEIEDLISLLWHTDDLILLDNWIVWSSVARQNFICLYQLLLQLDSALSCRYTWQITTKQDFYEVRLHRPIMFRTH